MIDQELRDLVASYVAEERRYYAACRPLFAKALEVYLSGNWREQFKSWEDYMLDTLTGHLDEDSIYRVVDCIPLLARLKTHPIVRNGVRIDHTTFLNGEMSDLEYLAMFIEPIDLKTAWGGHQFDECVWALFTVHDLELDHFIETIAKAKAPSFWKLRALWSKARRFFAVRPH